MAVSGLPGPSAIILGGALAMSTTAVAIQARPARVEAALALAAAVGGA